MSESYVYDHRGLLLRLTRTDLAGTTEWFYGYDVLGRLIGERIVVDGVTETKAEITHWDGSNRLAEFDAAGDLQRYYLSGPSANEVLAVDQLGETAWALTDQLGSVLAWGVYDAGWTVQHQTFDAFGNLEGGSQPIGSIGLLPTIWAGHQLDAATGFYHAQWRWYDPTTGRFLSQDPTSLAAGDANLYRYAGNDPVNSVDPTGLEETRREQLIRQIDAGEPYATGWTVVDAPIAFFDSVGRSVEKMSVGLFTHWDSDLHTGRVQSIVDRNRVVDRDDSITFGGALVHQFSEATTDRMAFGGVGFDPIANRALSGEERLLEVTGGLGTYAGTLIPLARVVAPASTLGASAANATRQRVLANIAESRAARQSSNFELHIARESQIGAPYGGVDNFRFTTLEQGSLVYGGVPGQSAYYTDFATVRASGLNAPKLFKSLQVAPHPVFGYRPGVQAYRVTEPLRVPSSQVFANPQFGSGGGNQFFIRNFESKLEPVR